MTTALDVITDAFNKTNENEAEAPIEPHDSQLALRELNRMMAALKLDVGWSAAASLTSTLTVKSDVEDYLVAHLAKRLAGLYEVPVSAALSDEVKDTWRELLKNYVRVEATDYHPNMPWWGRRHNTNLGVNGDYNGLERGRDAKTVSSDYTIVLTDDLVLVDCSNGPVTISLPTASSADGYGFEIQKIDQSSNQVIIDPNGSELVFGDATYRFNGYQETHEVVSNGSQWT